MPSLTAMPNTTSSMVERLRARKYDYDRKRMPHWELGPRPRIEMMPEIRKLKRAEVVGKMRRRPARRWTKKRPRDGDDEDAFIAGRPLAKRSRSEPSDAIASDENVNPNYLSPDEDEEPSVAIPSGKKSNPDYTSSAKDMDEARRESSGSMTYSVDTHGTPSLKESPFKGLDVEGEEINEDTVEGIRTQEVPIPSEVTAFVTRQNLDDVEEAIAANSGEVESKDDELVDNGGKIASKDAIRSVAPTVNVEDVSDEEEDAEIADLRSACRNQLPSDGILMEPVPPKGDDKAPVSNEEPAAQQPTASVDDEYLADEDEAGPEFDNAGNDDIDFDEDADDNLDDDSSSNKSSNDSSSDGDSSDDDSGDKTAPIREVKFGEESSNNVQSICHTWCEADNRDEWTHEERIKVEQRIYDGPLTKAGLLYNEMKGRCPDRFVEGSEYNLLWRKCSIYLHIGDIDDLMKKLKGLKAALRRQRISQRELASLGVTVNGGRQERRNGGRRSRISLRELNGLKSTLDGRYWTS